MDHIYKLTTRDEDWINSMAHGALFWEKDRKLFSDSDGEIENWQNWLHDVSALRCLKITKEL